MKAPFVEDTENPILQIVKPLARIHDRRAATPGHRSQRDRQRVHREVSPSEIVLEAAVADRRQGSWMLVALGPHRGQVDHDALPLHTDGSETVVGNHAHAVGCDRAGELFGAAIRSGLHDQVHVA